MTEEPGSPTIRGAARRRLRALVRDDRGAVAVLYALMLPVLIGFISLAVEIGIWYDVRRQAQNAADAAATAAAFTKANGGSDALAKAVATRDAKRNGWDPASGAITANIPPASGAYKGAASAAEIIVRNDVKLLLTGYFLGPGTEGIAARAVGTWSPSGSGAGACIIALDTSAGDAIHIYNNAMVTNANCGLIANSSSTMALHLDNNSMAAGPVSVVGRYLLQNNATLTNKNLVQGAAPIADPYAGITMPSKPACTGQTWQMTNTGTINLSPGHFCQGWNFANNVTVNLAPGIYYLDQAVNIQNNVWVNGTGGVTLVLGGNFNVNIGNTAYLTLNAPTSGPFQGIVMTTYSGATTGIVQNFANNSYLTINGALYFPNQDLMLQNNAATNSNNCTQIVARRISLTNNVVLGTNSCLAAGVKGTYPGQSAPLLAE